MKRLERLGEVLTTLFLLIVGLLGVTVSILDFIGTDFENGPWRWLKGPLPVILLIVALLALAVGLERSIRFQQIDRRLDSIESLAAEGPQRVIDALAGIEVRQFSDAQELYEYVTRRMNKARRIEDLTWGPAERGTTQVEENAVAKYVKTIAAICQRKDVSYREIMSFSEYDRLNHVNRAKSMLDKNLIGYRLRYYTFSQETMPPLLLFMVIDSEEVIIASSRAPFLSSEGEIQVAVKHPVIVKLFQDYFEAIWQGAKVLKEGDRVYYNELESIRRSLSGSMEI